MSLDLLKYNDVVHAERELFAYDPRFEIGQFRQGGDLSRKVGVGQEIDGIRDYIHGDEARHIDWIKTAQRPDVAWGGISVRQFFEEKAPLTVIVSDIPTDAKYAKTPGEPLSARSLGFIAARQIIEASASNGSPVIGYWTSGHKTDKKSKVHNEDPKAVARKVITEGLEVAFESTELSREIRERSGKKFLKRNREELILPEPTTLTETLEIARKKSLLIAGMARFVIISDFRSDTEDLLTSMKRLNNKGDVTAVQITNPLLREIPEDVERLSDGQGGSIIIETQAQRDRYKELQAERQAYINDKLKKSTTNAVTIDTAKPRVVKVV